MSADRDIPRMHFAARCLAVDDPLLVFDIEGRVREANPAAGRWTGIPLAELTGRSSCEVWPASLRDRLQAALRECLQSHRSIRFASLSPPEDRWFEFRFAPAPEGCVLLALDIHDLKTSELESQARESRTRQLIERAAVGIAEFSPEGTFVSVNDRLCEMLGRSRDEILRRTMRDLTHPDDLPRSEPEFDRLFGADQQDCAIEIRLMHRDGHPFWVHLNATAVRDEAGEIQRRIAIIEDVSQRRAAEEAQRLAEERFRVALKGSPIIIFNQDASLRYTWMNNEILGRSSEDFIGKTDAELLERREDAEFLSALKQRVMKTGIGLREQICIHFKGKPRYFDLTVEPLRDDNQDVVGVTCAAFDVTEHKQIERQLQSLNETLEQRVAERTALADIRASQLRALASELTQAEQRERRRLARTLHDHLQQLLVAAKLNISILRRKTQDPQLLRSLQQVDELLNESIEASRSLTVELSPPVLHDAGLGPALEWLARWMAERHGLKVEVCADDEAEPDIDELRIVLFEAVRELLFNVVKHAAVDEAQVRMEVLEDERTQITVSDKGAGFDTRTLDMEEAIPAGFGLFSIRQRLEIFGGEFQLESSPEQGTTVTLLAPARSHEVGKDGDESLREPAELSPAATNTTPTTIFPGTCRTARGKVRVLLADDQRILRAGLARLLQDQADIEVIGEAVDGVMAIEMARNLHPDVIVMDVTMPRLNGIEATRRIAAEMPEIRVIGLSFHEEEDMARQMHKAGAAAYLTKGGPADALIAAIRG